MRALIQRVSEAFVEVDGQEVGRAGAGLVIFLGVRSGDTEEVLRWVADKCVNLRIFEDESGRFNLSALDVGADLLVVSQFTLYGDARRGRRPSFSDAAPPAIAEPMYESFVEYLRRTGLRVETGRFAARMTVHVVNDGPVSILVEKEAEK